MKKKIFKALGVSFSLTLMLSLLAGCGQQEQETGLANPLTEVSAEEMTEATGITLTAPAEATDVQYFTLDSGDDSALIAQVVFTLNDAEYTYRAQSTSELEAYDLSGFEYDDWTTFPAEVAYCDGIGQTNDEAAVLYWLDVVPGIDYTLACAQGDAFEDVLDVANMIFEPMQGDAEPDVNSPDMTRDYAGLYMDGQDDNVCDTISFTATDDGGYNIEISINRLSSFEGKGYIMDGAVEFTVDDPNGGTIDGIFFPTDAEGVYNLMFTRSDWDLIEDGTTFENFVEVE